DEPAGRNNQINCRVVLQIQLIDADVYSSDFFIWGPSLIKEQMDLVFDLMDETKENLKDLNEIRRHDTERRIYRTFPIVAGNYGFAEGVVKILPRESEASDLFERCLPDRVNVLRRR
ncbi:MAG: hypothetical protein ACM3S2_02965, partial [Ignavibacteriales bacterium]